MMDRRITPDERIYVGGFHDAIFTYLKDLPGVEATLASLREVETKIELDPALRAAKIFVEYNTNPGSEPRKMILGRFHHPPKE